MVLGWVSDNVESFSTKRNMNDVVKIVEFTGSIGNIRNYLMISPDSERIIYTTKSVDNKRR